MKKILIIMCMLLLITATAHAESWEFLGTYKTTGYELCVRCCGKTDGITASGTKAEVGRTCAAPKDIPFGARLYIEGVGYRTVEDRGEAIRGNKIDVLCANHSACYAITGWRRVWIVRD